jgi:hypothetical protein
MATKSEIFAKDLRETIERDFPETVKIGVNTYDCLVEDFADTEEDQPGGPDAIGSTRIHLMKEQNPIFKIGGKCTVIERKLDLMILFSSLSPDKNHIILTLSRI